MSLKIKDAVGRQPKSPRPMPKKPKGKPSAKPKPKRRPKSY